MATVYRRKGCANYYAAFLDAEGRRHYRSTKTTRRADAVRVASEMERMARRVSEAPEDERRVLAILQEATERALRGTLSVAVARELMNQLNGCVNGERLYEPTVEEWFTKWVEGKKGARTEGTCQRYQAVVEAFLEGLPERVRRSRLDALRIDHIKAHRDALVAEGRAETTANIALKTIRSVLNTARKQGLILHSPADAVELLTPRIAEKDVFTPEQVAAMVAVCDHAWRGMILAGYFSGTRISDLADLRWDSVDLDSGLLTLAQRKTGTLVAIPIHPDLRKWFELTPAEQRKGYVFPEFAGRVVGGRNGLSGMFRRIMERAGIEGKVTEKRGRKGRNRSSLSFHSLRHSFNSAMANAGVPQEVRQRLTGHASRAVNDRYTHTELETLRKAVETVPRVG